LSDVATLTDYEREITFNVGTVAGGTVVNRVPHLAMASGEARAYDEAILDAGIENLLKLSEQTAVVSAKDGYRCEIEINILGKWAPWSPNKSTDRLLQVWQKAGQRLDYRVVGEKRGGLSDGNQTWNFVPTLDGLGPAGRNAHCSERTGDGSKDQEFVWRKSFVPKSLLNVVGIVDLLQASGQRNR
jgi:glutamate carboxypeptidase